ncbi:CDKN2A-interacting protein isoform X2 [Gopherus flavomarginatus]|uniref:CDKN2A-interacting protein isoform X2 n=1 Tax=Gopherus flavomarginatus TaxID=286002 RepID=UPI0021CC1220|nr:CDKN2A-interacting protein isoform X2 [Gopherus flavomarginatus]
MDRRKEAANRLHPLFLAPRAVPARPVQRLEAGGGPGSPVVGLATRVQAGSRCSSGLSRRRGGQAPRGRAANMAEAAASEPLGRSREETAWVETLRGDCEPEHHWRHRREFLLRNAGGSPAGDSGALQRLVSLSMVWANHVFLGCRYPLSVMEKVLEMAEGIKVTDAPAHTTRDELVAKVKKRGISSSNEGVEEPCKKRAVDKSRDCKDVGNDAKLTKTEVSKETESTLPKKEEKDVGKDSEHSLSSSISNQEKSAVPGTGTETKAANYETTTKQNSTAAPASSGTESRMNYHSTMETKHEKKSTLPGAAAAATKSSSPASTPALAATKSSSPASAPAAAATKSGSQASAPAAATKSGSQASAPAAAAATKSGSQASAPPVATKSGSQASAPAATKSGSQASAPAAEATKSGSQASAPAATKSGSQASAPAATKSGSQASAPAAAATKSSSQASAPAVTKSGSQASAPAAAATKSSSQASAPAVTKSGSQASAPAAVATKSSSPASAQAATKSSSQASAPAATKSGSQASTAAATKSGSQASALAAAATKSGSQASALAAAATKSGSQASAPPAAAATKSGSQASAPPAAAATKSGSQASAPPAAAATKSGSQASAPPAAAATKSGSQASAPPAAAATKSGSQASAPPAAAATKSGSQASAPPAAAATKSGSQASALLVASKSSSQTSASAVASKSSSQTSESPAKVSWKPLTSEDAKERQPFFNRLYKSVAWKLVAVGGFSPNVNHAELLNSSIQSVKATLDVTFVPLKELADLPQNKSSHENIVCELRCKSVYLGTGCGKSKENAKAIASREALKLFLKKNVIVKICKRKYKGREIEDLVLLDEESKPSNLPPALRNPQEIL